MITQISYQYRFGTFEGTEEFKTSLKEHYNVHELPKWMPAAGGNYEMWFDFFIETSLIDFLKSAIVGGATFELARLTIFKPFLDALNKLNQANNNSLEVQKYRFYFEDTKIVVYGLTENFIAIFAGIFKELFETYELISKEREEDVFEIRIPVDPESRRNEWWVGPGELKYYLTYWGVTIMHGVEHFIWDVQHRKEYEGEDNNH